MVNVYGVVAAAIGVFLLAWTIRAYLKGRMRIVPYAFWTVVWLALITTAMAPDLYGTLTAYLGMSTPIHFVTSFSVVALLAITYELHRKIGDLDSKMSKIVQEMALLQMPQGRSKKESISKD